MAGVARYYWEQCIMLRQVRNLIYRRMLLGRAAEEGESPVIEMDKAWWIIILSTAGHEESCRKQGGPPSKAKY